MVLNYKAIIMRLGCIVLYLLMLLYQSPQGISGQFYIACLIVLGLLAIVISIGKNKNGVVRIATILTVVMVANACLNYVNRGEQLLYIVCYICLWFMSLSITHLYNHESDEKRFYVKLTVIYFIMAAIIFSMYLSPDYSNTNKFYEVTKGYYVLCLLPCVLIIHNKWARMIAVSLVTGICIMTFKRGILISLLTVASAYLIQLKKKGRSRKYMKITGYVLAVCAVIFFSNSQIVGQINGIWVTRFLSEGTVLGARGDIYSDVLNALANSSIFEWFFGHGYNGVMIYTVDSFSAHNDFLEVLFDYGLFALGVYIWMIIVLINEYIKLRRQDNPHGFAFLASICIFLVSSLFSHMITYPTYFAIIAAFWGWVLPRRECYKRSGG